MSDAIIVAILSCVGTGAGAVVSVLTANRITNFKIERLEEQVKKHNNLIDRMYKVEGRCEIIETDIKVVNRRIGDLEGGKQK